MKIIDLRSDTVTLPTQEMREAMFNAEVGDDVYAEDTSLNELETYAARLVGKESALFVPSGTFGNQLALLTHCKRGDEVIVGETCHILQHEVGAASVIAGVQLRTVPDAEGILNPTEVEIRIRRAGNIHHPETGLVCIENAHSNGRVGTLENMKEISELAEKYVVPLHLDGARMFNAAVCLGVDASDIAQYCDSVMFCLSKGLCAPVGSMLAGSREFIDKARKGRKLMGGGIRQGGFLAAAGLIALKKMRHRLKEDHDNAQFLGKELNKIDGLRVRMDDIHINMVYADIRDTDYSVDQLVIEMRKKGIRVSSVEDGLIRFVTNHGVCKDDISYAAESMRQILL